MYGKTMQMYGVWNINEFNGRTLTHMIWAIWITEEK